MQRVSFFDSSYQQYKLFILLGFLMLFSLESYGQNSISYSYSGIADLPLRKPTPSELHTYYLNHGYPYATVTLAQVIDSSHTVWEVNTGPRVTLDSLICKSALVHYKTLCRLAHFSPGEAFSERAIAKTTRNLQKIPGIQLCGSPTYYLEGTTFSFEQCLSKLKSNRIEALIGINNNPLTGKTNLTGNLDLKLENMAHLAESFELNWKRPYPNSQSFNIKLAAPFTLGLPVGFATQFQSFLKDSTFATGNFNFQMLTGANANEGLVLYVQRNTATSFQSSSVFGNTKAKMYGAKQSFNLESQRYKWNATLDLAHGNRIIDGESTGVTRSLTKINAALQCTSNWKSRYFIQWQSSFSHLQSDSLFTNELMRLGGMQSLRGFMDESVYTSSYSLHCINAGIKLGPDFQLYALFDYATLFKPERKNYYNPGLGIKLNQGNSAVNLTYAIGNLDGSALQVRNGRVGVSLVSSF